MNNLYLDFNVNQNTSGKSSSLFYRLNFFQAPETKPNPRCHEK